MDCGLQELLCLCCALCSALNTFILYMYVSIYYFLHEYDSILCYQIQYTTSCCLWSVVSLSRILLGAALSLLRAALHAPCSFQIVVLITNILLQRGDIWNIFPQNDVCAKILIYALGLICQVMRCVGHDLRPRSTMRVTEQYIGGALGAYGKMIARKS